MNRMYFNVKINALDENRIRLILRQNLQIEQFVKIKIPNPTMDLSHSYQMDLSHSSQMDLLHSSQIDLSRTSYMPNPFEEQWEEKLRSLEKQLIEARLEQEHLKRINKSLQNTLKLATIDQPQSRSSFSSTHRMSFNLNPREKAYQPIQRNQNSKCYIKEMERKKTSRNSLSINKIDNNQYRQLIHPTRKQSIPILSAYPMHGLDHSQYYKKIISSQQCTPSSSKNKNMRLKSKRNNSVSKMNNFIDSLFNKDSLSKSNKPILTQNTHQLNRDRLCTHHNKILTTKKSLQIEDRMFYSEKGKKYKQNHQRQWDLIDKKISTKCNLHINEKKSVLNTHMNTHKLQLTQFR